MSRLAFGPRVDRAGLNGGRPQGPRAGAGGIRCFPDRRPQLELSTEHQQISNRGGGAGGGRTQLNKTLPLMPKVLALLPGLTPGQVAIVSN